MKSRVQKKETRWEKLDNTANLFPVIANETMTNVYRIAVILSENIEPECLQEALEQVLPWFNTMNVRMRTGMFWYYFETNVKGLRAMGDGASVTRGLQQASANGLSVARSIINKSKAE